MRTVGPSGWAHEGEAAARRVGPVAKALESCSSAESRSADAVVGHCELECA